ncbi:MAG TPA: hypothetical protein VNA32_10270 [Actinomycetota bacterium]|nr:hypothetical protein [Actinomycetota bacterium]
MTLALGACLLIPNLRYVVKAALLGVGMSEEFASLLVEMLLSVNEGRMIDEVKRTAESNTPTRGEEFLSTALGPMSSP